MQDLSKHVQSACSRIAPAWPLNNQVAVNPFLGFADSRFEDAALKFMNRGGISITMPLKFYLQQISSNIILKEDIVNAHLKLKKQMSNYSDFIYDLEKKSKVEDTIKWKGTNLIDIATSLSDINWVDFMVESVSSWASAHFDVGFTNWNSEKENLNIYLSWKSYAETDLSSEIMGLKGFRKFLKTLPNEHHQMIQSFINEIKIEPENIEAYIHSLLLKTTGWSSFISGIDFNNNLYEGKTDNLIEYLAVLIAWERYFYFQYDERVKSAWYRQMHEGVTINKLLSNIVGLSVVLQEAYDLASQRELISIFKNHQALVVKSKPKAQIAFCIDVRSEIFRRHLESVDNSLETIGFAGFFGFPIRYRPLGYEKFKNQCPVLIPSSLKVIQTSGNKEKSENDKRNSLKVRKVWKRFKTGAVTSFGFVSPLGLSYLLKIISDSFSWTRPESDPKVYGLKSEFQDSIMLDLAKITLNQKTDFAEGALIGMGIKNSMAPIVIIAGHGSSSINNPHASGLECGACGGHSGEINALTAQMILNDSEVRKSLVTRGIDIPNETLFVACLHNTSTDQFSIVNEKLIPHERKNQLDEIFKSIHLASNRTRIERAQRLNFDKISVNKIKDVLLSRVSDWSQVRPEWGLASCNAFIIANREKTKGLNLKGRAFLHNYDWKSDPEDKLLESIVTAPMVVTSWINLQYYASTVDNKKFGAGNKTLHNVTAGCGVLEGSGGDLRIGLPIQSVHNGTKYEHLPQRLIVIIEAPVLSINKILKNHDSIKQLFDNSWISLHRLDENGNVSHTYHGDLEWKSSEMQQFIEKKIVTNQNQHYEI